MDIPTVSKPGNEERSKIIVPQAHPRYLDKMKELFAYTNADLGLVALKYIEALNSASGKNMWKVEYDTQPGREFLRKELRNIGSQLMTDLGGFECFDIFWNYNNRIYLFVYPAITTSSSISDSENENTNSIQERPSNSQTLDMTENYGLPFSGNKNRSTIIVPQAQRKSVKKMYKLFSYTNAALGLMKNKYNEALSSASDKDMWIVEYTTQPGRTFRKKELNKIRSQLMTDLGEFMCFDIFFNYDNRIYLFVYPNQM